MKVILISEENHGIIGCVASEKDVMPWLTRENWVNQYTEIDKQDACGYMCGYETIKERFGLTWFQTLSKMSLDDLAEVLGYFCFEPIEVWGAS